MPVALILATTTLAIWLYLLLARGAFWTASVRDDAVPETALPSWPQVTAVMPARNEAGTVGASLHSLFKQDYPGPFDVILVDDQSRDGTSAVAAAVATDINAQDRLTIIPGRPLPKGWAGKVWAMNQGIDRLSGQPSPPKYLLFIDADIACTPDTLRTMVARAEAGGLVLVSLMARLRCKTWAERALIPAFIFFFQMLYPFAWVNDRDHETAAAAGGCMLVHRDALHEIGGISSIRNALIDDCAVAKKLKSAGPIWLGLADRATSLRAYPHVADIRQMVSRSAYHQLHYSPALLIATTAAMALTFLAPPLLVLAASGTSRIIGALCWAIMTLAFQPILRFYRLSPLWGVALPVTACAYMVFTLNSAYQHLRGTSGLWKGRIHESTPGTR